MKTTLMLLIFFYTFFYSSLAQEKRSVIVKAGSSIAETLTPSDIYRYPQFLYGEGHYKDGKVAGAKLNYNILLQDVQFINRTDTLSVITDNLDYISIGRDTFYYDKVYVNLYMGHPVIKLAVMPWIRLGEKQKIGAYGMPSSSSSIDNYNQLSIGSTVQKLTVKEDQVLIWEKNYYVGDEHNRFALVNRKNLLDMFPKYRTQIKDYLKENNVNFTKEDEVVKLIEHLQKAAS